ncbi:hypothetical protein EDD52_112122 [Primorskyibacter sedentarius]|uniref:Uncharacterized protein n=1 Tax=Primorskyibacter sedentarius TaxID=745311 RepID=A0A4R3J721_9RHOB|nr:hypothetical protein [Primorskyibacter sedentarius]TCS61164.1 hypothetical protein EDD52_112122 [Primorskyibacter sedentarius]
MAEQVNVSKAKRIAAIYDALRLSKLPSTVGIQRKRNNLQDA